MLPKRSESVRDHVLLWLTRMKEHLEYVENTGDIRTAYVACAQLAGSLALASSLRLIRPGDIQHWTGYMTSKSAELEPLLFGPNLEEGRTS